jgi:aminoglycoside phosphotransferase family enzyme/predicted kinase
MNEHIEAEDTEHRSAPGSEATREEAERRRQTELISALRDPARFGPPNGHVTVLETHISYVLLTGSEAYKIKKAVRLGFLDFTTLERRKFYCEEELRLNRRLAPALYLDAVPITGTSADPQIRGAGPVVEYAVRMKEFARDALASDFLARGALTGAHIDLLAGKVADFHAVAARADAGTTFGSGAEALDFALANFTEIRALKKDGDDAPRMRAVAAWTRAEHTRRRQAFDSRKRDGFVRECHGDLHLSNIAIIDGAVTIFDCIEFNERMRWIDVMSEVAFTTMDLDRRGRSDFARRFLNRYLEETGDYDGIAVLPFYLVYRAMVRAKVASIGAAGIAEERARAAFLREYKDYLHLAEAYTASRQAAIVVTHGFAGCGKTTVTQSLLERMDAVRVRSDVERKRLANLRADARSQSGIASNLYARDMTRRTYEELSRLARHIVESGYVALIDAAFLQLRQREIFRSLAAELDVPFVIVDVAAAESTLRERVRRRALMGRDASEADIAVLEHQILTHEPFADHELADVIRVDTDLPEDRDGTEALLLSLVERLGTDGRSA